MSSPKKIMINHLSREEMLDLDLSSRLVNHLLRRRERAWLTPDDIDIVDDNLLDSLDFSLPEQGEEQLGHQAPIGASYKSPATRQSSVRQHPPRRQSSRKGYNSPGAWRKSSQGVQSRDDYNYSHQPSQQRLPEFDYDTEEGERHEEMRMGRDEYYSHASRRVKQERDRPSMPSQPVRRHQPRQLFHHEEDYDEYANDRGFRQHDMRDRMSHVQIPRTLTFNGQGRWETFENRFERFITYNSIGRLRDQLYFLSLTLEGQALDYFDRLQERTTFSHIRTALDEMQERFGNQELEQSAMLRLNQAYQEEKESVHEWVDRLWNLALQAFPRDDKSVIERQVLSRFVTGLWDRRAVQHLSCQMPSTVNEAVKLYRLFANAQAISARPRRDNRTYQPAINQQMVRFREPEARAIDYDHDESDYSEEDFYEPRQVKAVTRGRPQQNYNSRDRQNDLIDTVLAGQKRIEEKLDKLIELQTKALERSTLRQRSRSNSPSGNCYRCGQSGHFLKNCPQEDHPQQSESPKDKGSI